VTLDDLSRGAELGTRPACRLHARVRRQRMPTRQHASHCSDPKRHSLAVI
jgi:hypothetical protein